MSYSQSKSKHHRDPYSKPKPALAMAVVVFVCLMLFSTTLLAQVKSYTVGVDGMACPFCAYGVEKKLMAIDGVDEVTIRIKDGEVDVPTEKTVTPEQIQSAIEKAGFEMRDLEVAGSGTITSDNGAVIEFAEGLSLPIPGYDGEVGRFSVTGKVVHKGDRWVLDVTEREAE